MLKNLYKSGSSHDMNFIIIFIKRKLPNKYLSLSVKIHNFNLLINLLNFSAKPKAFNVTYRATYRDCYLIT